MSVSWGVPIAAAAVAAVSDVRHRRIPNLLTGPLLLAGILWGITTSRAWDPFVGALIAGAPYIALWLLGGGGAGDAKMMIAIGAWVGPVGAVFAVLAVAIAGGIISIIHAMTRRQLVPALANTAWALASLRCVLLGSGKFASRREMLPIVTIDVMQKVPYAVAILIGTCAGAMWSMLWTTS
jgi:prepilin peptidase CpaA